MNISNINTSGNAITDSIRDYTTAKGSPMSTHTGPSVALVLTVSHVRFRVYGLGVGSPKTGATLTDSTNVQGADCKMETSKLLCIKLTENMKTPPCGGKLPRLLI